jgi:hypothetical protein
MKNKIIKLIERFEYIDRLRNSRYFYVGRDKPNPYPELSIKQLIATTLFSLEGQEHLRRNENIPTEEIKKLEKIYKWSYKKSELKMLYCDWKYIITGK